MARGPFSGVLAPVATPFTRDLQIDTARFTAFAHDLLKAGCHGLVPFGTTGEGPSLSVEERRGLLAALTGSGIPGERLMVGVGTCSLDTTVRLTCDALDAGAGGVLLLPPFFFKKIDDDGLAAYVDALIAQVNDPRLQIYLYHIPPHAGIGWSPALVERLAQTHPDTVVGVKDSGGDFAYTRDVLTRLPDFGAFIGTERQLGDVLDAGGVGTITTTANANPAGLRRAFDQWRGTQGQALMDAAGAYRKTVEGFPTVPGIKALIAHERGDPEWARVRPPLTDLAGEQRDRLLQRVGELEALAPAPKPA
ncbi:4-hydroxy-tetrahydrodipicolinate synthase [Limimonas halophila]|uniref:4-hydroxy-tetrahydrodipicolinate synthase n=1 Tax=Limimonas halophila TaxID=1082479 RepID=A0A1G7UYC9_9PROT|nr:dihydrodipicolinate synthase family protein [Limimonas halophila]SDG52516.1 4-hydroxy-tetrahydrodipicolinate synthase [Limimonas halophila]